jgi:hypothetical protein
VMSGSMRARICPLGILGTMVLGWQCVTVTDHWAFTFVPWHAGADVIAVACKLFYSSLQQLPACEPCASFYSRASDSLTMMGVLPCSSVASAVAPPQLKEFLTSIEWESKDEAFVDAVIQELAENDIMVPGNITLTAFVGSTAVSYRLCPNCATPMPRTWRGQHPLARRRS